MGVAVSIGEALAEARRRAGLSVTEVSRRTRIRESIVSGIERDDFTGCGGDAYARGHIRAIAHEVGIDPEPLVTAYDEAGRAREQTAPDAAEPATPERRRPRRAALVGAVVLALAALAGYLITSATGHARPASSAATAHRTAGHPAPVRHLPPSRPSATRTPSATVPTRSAAPVRRRSARALEPARVMAFGPAGPGQGDNPQLASLGLDGTPAAPWHSDWYTTPRFGNLQSGTGLLVDMGRPVTVTRALIALDSGRGADIDLRIGDAPVLADLATAAHAANAGGLVRLNPATAPRGRYVLVWFTRLPPDRAGTFQASLYRIRLWGHP